MLVVKQVEAENPSELVYECYDGDRRVGRLTATPREDATLEVALSQTEKREAGRALVAKLERDAAAHGLTGLYLQARDEREREAFIPAGYDPVGENSLRLLKPLPRK